MKRLGLGSGRRVPGGEVWGGSQGGQETHGPNEDGVDGSRTTITLVSHGVKVGFRGVGE